MFLIIFKYLIKRFPEKSQKNVKNSIIKISQYINIIKKRKETMMGLFVKKRKKLCPICGNELKLLSSLAVDDGEICSDCEKMLRGQFNITEYWKQRWGTKGFDRADYVLKNQ